MRAMARLLLGAFLLSMTVFGVNAAQATNIGNQGCTPGYWKNHTKNWEETTPSTLFSSLYKEARSNVASKTLVQALQGGGGPGADGGAIILARAATAAWLNAAHEGLGYPWRRNTGGEGGRPPLVPTVNAAFVTGDRATMLALAERLDKDNNLGCPLN
jgi:hypothetical protein